MPDQSRLDVLEGRVEEQSKNWERLFSEVSRLSSEVGRLSSAVGRLFSEVGRLDQKIDTLGATLSARFDARIDSIDQKFDRKIDDVRADLLKQFRWTIGVMVTLSMGLLAAILTR
jgi:hypothetical protein